MFAVIRTGGKQYKVAKDDIITVEKLLGEPGEKVQLGDVLMLGEEGKAPTVGAPLVQKAAVTAEIVEQGKGDKVIVFKKKRRHNYRRTKGHRQEQTTLKILEVSATGTKAAAKKTAASKADGAGGAKPAKKAPTKKTAAKKETAASKTAAKKTAAKKAPAKKDSAKDTDKE
tara:strand:- start:734 stop:1246 length:513 start_codon:yes stop_codon:yes gene_type:complete